MFAALVKLLALLSIFSLLSCQQSENSEGTPPGEQLFVIHFRISAAEEAVDLKLQEGTLKPLADDAFGKRFLVASKAKALSLTVQRQGMELDQFAIEQAGEGVWLFAGSPQVFLSPPPLLPENEQDLVVYFIPRPEQAQGPWGLHIWDSETNTNFTRWESPLELQATEGWGWGTRLDVPPRTSYSASPQGYSALPSKLGLIVHEGDSKATAGDIAYEPARHGRMIFVSGDSAKIYCSPDLKPCGWHAEIDGASAHWVRADEILWRVDPKAARYLLLSSRDAALELHAVDSAVADASIPRLELTLQAEVSSPVKAKFPHLKTFASFRVQAGTQLDELVQSELVAVALNAQGRAIAATGLQLGGVLDEAFAYDGALGLVIAKSTQLKLWAPTAQAVSLQVYTPSKALQSSLPMREQRGVWSVTIPRAWLNQGFSYRYAMRVYHPLTGRLEHYEVTDPYAVSSPLNGSWSSLLDLNSPKLKPQGWDALPLPVISRPTDKVYYEMHIRDFSSRDPSVPKPWRGSYRAFTLNGMQGRGLSQGMAHLKALQSAGLTHVQVLPAYDFGSVNEDRKATINLDSSWSELCKVLPTHEALCDGADRGSIFDVFSALPKESAQIASLNAALIDRDSFNWGYDPVHYGMPEGSYVSASDLDEGEARVLEFRSMRQGLAEIGLHLAMDVVYNHTYSSGLNHNAVLDRVVPGYYHRLDPTTGGILHSSCCENTASERVMM